jgi:hypothetical protein
LNCKNDGSREKEEIFFFQQHENKFEQKIKRKRNFSPTAHWCSDLMESLTMLKGNEKENIKSDENELIFTVSLDNAQ